MWAVFSESGILVAKIWKIFSWRAFIYIYIYRKVARCLQQIITDYNTNTLYILI